MEQAAVWMKNIIWSFNDEHGVGIVLKAEGSRDGYAGRIKI